LKSYLAIGGPLDNIRDTLEQSNDKHAKRIVVIHD